ncbi:MAG TPA: hypothetical protein PKW33_08035 [Anaerolineaceae bacterium]|nr:hypothetical protein [Anaerolineaceae bacterium]HPN51523.1 hypothetical protein [Anaerolineaceae bacterium]
MINNIGKTPTPLQTPAEGTRRTGPAQSPARPEEALETRAMERTEAKKVASTKTEKPADTNPVRTVRQLAANETNPVSQTPATQPSRPQTTAQANYNQAKDLMNQLMNLRS